MACMFMWLVMVSGAGVLHSASAIPDQAITRIVLLDAAAAAQRRDALVAAQESYILLKYRHTAQQLQSNTDADHTKIAEVDNQRHCLQPMPVPVPKTWSVTVPAPVAALVPACAYHVSTCTCL